MGLGPSILLDRWGEFFSSETNHSYVWVTLLPQQSFETAVCQENCHPRKKKSRITQKQSLLVWEYVCASLTLPNILRIYTFSVIQHSSKTFNLCRYPGSPIDQRNPWLVFRMIHGSRIPDPTKGQSLVWLQLPDNIFAKLSKNTARWAPRSL